MKDYFLLFILTFFVSCTESESEINEIEVITDEAIIVDSPASISIENDSAFITGVMDFPQEVFNHPNLKYISVWGQDCDIAGMPCYAIDSIPNRIDELTELEELHLGLNYIDELPPNILKLEKLRVLDMLENPGFNDVETVAKIQSLEEFTCFGCRLTEEEKDYLRENLPNCELNF
ncbi:MAG: hypothetical protein MK078_04685 [Crocinitomicaceae bacterium]|nr:hypothetical protein [Crocinitomicaceae bacterium]